MRFEEKLQSMNQSEIARLDNRITNKIYQCFKRMETLKTYNPKLWSKPKPYAEFNAVKKQIDDLKKWEQNEIGNFVETILKTRNYKKPYS
jgi:hypothetical protein